MDRFTARNALETGVELIRRRPLLVLLWAAVLLAPFIVFAAAGRELAAIARADIFSGRPVGAFNGQFLSLSLVEFAVSLITAAVLWCSAFRAILRPADRRPLGFGPEELSVLATWIIVQAIVAIVSAGLPILIVQQFPSLGPRLAVEAVAVGNVLGLFWSAVASVWTFDRGQIAPFRCWTIARGRFWLLAGQGVRVAVLERLAGAEVRQLAAALGNRFPVARASPLEPFGVAGPRVQDVFRIPALLQDVLLASLGALEIAFIAGVVASAYRAGAPRPQAEALSSTVAGRAG